MVTRTTEISNLPIRPLAWSRPTFPTAEDFVEHVRYALGHGERPWPAQTKAEIVLTMQAFPSWMKANLPQPDILEEIGLPRDYGRPLPPLDYRMKRQIVETLQADKRFARLVREALKHG